MRVTRILIVASLCFLGHSLGARTIVGNCLILVHGNKITFAPINKERCQVEPSSGGFYQYGEEKVETNNGERYKIDGAWYSLIQLLEKGEEQRAMGIRFSNFFNFVGFVTRLPHSEADKIAITLNSIEGLEDNVIDDMLLNAFNTQFDANHVIYSALMKKFPDKSAMIYDHIKKYNFSSYGFVLILKNVVGKMWLSNDIVTALKKYEHDSCRLSILRALAPYCGAFLKANSEAVLTYFRSESDKNSACNFLNDL